MPTFVELNSNYQINSDDQNEKKKFSLSFSKIRNKPILLLPIFMIFALILPFLLYFIIFDGADLSKPQNICLVDNRYRLPCGKENISETNCLDILCCFERYTNSCYHSEPSNYFYFQKNSKSGIFVPSQKCTPLGLQSLNELNISIIEETQKLRIILNDTKITKLRLKDGFSNFDVLENENDKLSVSVFRKQTHDMLLTTLKGPLIASERYLEWTVQLTNSSGVLFGLGQLKIALNENSTLTKIIYKNQNDHNTLPVFMAYNDQKYHAVVILHEGALQVTVLPSYLIFLRSISGKRIEIQLIDGPTPKDIYDKLRNGGEESNLIPEWGLGVHICREKSAKNMKSLLAQYTSFITNRNSKYPNFKYESDCIHDDLLVHLLAENYTSLQFANMLNDLKMSERLVMSYPPQIPINSVIFDQYKESDIFYKNSTTGNIYIGKYKGFDVVFPNYKHKDINQFITDIKKMFGSIELDGLVFTNSWPQDENFQMGNSTEPYINTEAQAAFSNTLPWNLTEQNDFHLRYHNEYGDNLQDAVSSQLTFKNEHVTFSPVSDIKTYGPLIVQNLNTSWANLKVSLRTSLYNSLFGHSLISVPVCGSNDYDQELNEDLCLRWYLFAATMPLVRISSKGLPRDPTNLYTTYTSDKVIDILEKRKSLIPYYRTILNEGGPIVRPMFFNFPGDKNVHSLDEQYMIGDKILVAQPMLPDLDEIKIYLPPNNTWYEFEGGLRYTSKKDQEWIKFPIFKSDWVSFILEGSIIPRVTRPENGNTEINLIVALNCTTICQADGSLLLHFPDDQLDVPVEFSATNKTIQIDTIKEKYDEIKKMINKICFYTYNSTENSCN